MSTAAPGRTTGLLRRLARWHLSWALLPLVGCGAPGSPGGASESVASPLVADVGAKDQAWALTVLPSGKLIVGGSSLGQSDRAVVGRLHADTTVDVGFGGGGGVPGFTISDLPAFHAVTASRAYAVAVQPRDGKIVIAGHAWAVGHDSRMLVARYSSDGVLDATFGNGGYLDLDAHPDSPLPGFTSGDDAFALALQGDGKIVVGGSAAVSHAQNGSGSYWSDFALFRLDAAGKLDPTFGAGGVVITNWGNSAFIHAVVVQGDGKIVAGGFAAPGGTYDLALARYDGSGALDPTFGQQGLSLTDLGGDDRVWGLSQLGDGRLVAGGQTSVAGVARFAIARFHADGTPDKTFGGGTGWSSTAAPDGKAVAQGVAVAKDCYYLGGWAVGAEGNFDFALARYTTAGVLDGCKQQPGLAVLPTAPGVDDAAFAIALGLDGLPVLAGYSGSDLAVRQVKLAACPAPDPDDDHHGDCDHHGDDDHHGKCDNQHHEKDCDDDHHDRGDDDHGNKPGKHGRD